jgi:hypothetical protein
MLRISFYCAFQQRGWICARRWRIPRAQISRPYPKVYPLGQ